MLNRVDSVVRCLAHLGEGSIAERLELEELLVHKKKVGCGAKKIGVMGVEGCTQAIDAIVERLKIRQCSAGCLKVSVDDRELECK